MDLDQSSLINQAPAFLLKNQKVELEEKAIQLAEEMRNDRETPDWEKNVKNENPHSPYPGKHPSPDLEYEEIPRQYTPGIDPDDWSHTTRNLDEPGYSRFWRPRARPSS